MAVAPPTGSSPEMHIFIKTFDLKYTHTLSVMLTLPPNATKATKESNISCSTALYIAVSPACGRSKKKKKT